jgi:hypothetical protein
MTPTRSFRAACPLLIVALVAVAGCNRKGEAPTPPEPPFAPDATIKELMLNVVDTSADTVWLSVTAVQSEQGLIETRPRNDDEWNTVRRGAITLAEAANLLMIPGRRVARPGEKSETPGVELEPTEMDALIAENPDAWNQRASALHLAAMHAVEATDAHDADRIFEVGEEIENACEGCHRQYWYPNEKLPDFQAAP